jgi:PAS domain S-box-containing protein
MQSSWVISTNLARCRDCYRCVRACPVKAIRVKEGQAQVVPELCIACGNCVWVCPQKAKLVRDDRPEVKEALRSGRAVVASVAPSFPAYFNLSSLVPMEESLRTLGFKGAEETAFGAQMVGLAHKDFVEQNPGRWPVITSSCPAIVNYIEKYFPDLIPHLAPIVSPMIAHGRWLRNLYGPEAYIVFIGPCIAKKDEMKDEPVSQVIDAALTFAELREWLEEEEVPFQVKETGLGSDQQSIARLFPIEGGLVGTAAMDTDRLASQIITATGIEACQDVLSSMRKGQLKARLVELMACEGGCINGPVMRGQESAFLSRQKVIEYSQRNQPKILPDPEGWPDLKRSFLDESLPAPEFSEEQIRKVLELVEKYTPEDELNCNACGYPSCRDKAIATLRGMAEATMCIPYMRRRAESLRQVVMDVTPDAILIVDKNLNLQDLSPSAEKMFRCHHSLMIGQPLDQMVPETEGFTQVRDTGKSIFSQTIHLRDDLIVEETVVPVKDQRLLVGILRDVTERERQHQELERIRNETLNRTQGVIINQMRVAQEIAQLLGESTAETKMMLSRLAKLLKEGQDS